MTETFVTKLELYVREKSMEETARTVSQMLWREAKIAAYRNGGYWSWEEFRKLAGKL